FLEKLQPATCSLGSKGDPRPHWRAEKCFFRCACPRKKQILIYFPAPGRKNSAEGFLWCKTMYFSCMNMRLLTASPFLQKSPVVLDRGFELPSASGTQKAKEIQKQVDEIQIQLEGGVNRGPLQQRHIMAEILVVLLDLLGVIG